MEIEKATEKLTAEENYQFVRNHGVPENYASIYCKQMW